MPDDFNADFFGMLDARYRKIEMCLLQCIYAKTCKEKISKLRKSFLERLDRAGFDAYEKVRDEEATLSGFLEEGAYKVGFLDGMEAAFLSLDKGRALKQLIFSAWSGTAAPAIHHGSPGCTAHRRHEL